jgi:hypothetical protein
MITTLVLKLCLPGGRQARCGKEFELRISNN